MRVWHGQFAALGEMPVKGKCAMRSVRLLAWMTTLFPLWVVLGCGWLDREARRSGEPDFASLPPAQKESIVSAAESSSPQSMP